MASLSIHDYALSEHVEDFTQMLFSISLISEKERIILAYAISQIDILSSFRDANNTIYTIMDNDSALSHREQLIVALSLAYSKKKKRLESLILKYMSILEQKDRKSIKKISSIIVLFDILNKTHTRMNSSLKNSILLLQIYPKKNTFPEILFRQTCKRLEESMNIHVKAIISYQS